MDFIENVTDDLTHTHQLAKQNIKHHGSVCVNVALSH